MGNSDESGHYCESHDSGKFGDSEKAGSSGKCCESVNSVEFENSD